MKEMAIKYFKFQRKIFCENPLKICPKDSIAYQATLKEKGFYDMAIKALEQQSCEMTAEEYRQRMIQAFHNADCDELIAICVLPTEKEFEHLEWLLKNHYKKQPFEDCISRQAVLEGLRTCYDTETKEYSDGSQWINYEDAVAEMENLPPATPQQKTGHWVEENINEGGRKVFCSECGCPPPFEHVSDGDVYSASGYGVINKTKFCPNCGTKMVELQEGSNKE